MAKQVSLRLDIDEERMTVRGLIVLLEKSLEWLRGMDPESPAPWNVVRLRTSRPFSITFENPIANGIVTNRIDNLYGLSRNSNMDRRLTDAELEGTRQLLGVMRSERIRELCISSPGQKRVKVTPKLMEAVETRAKAAEQTHRQWTTIRGELDQVTASIEIKEDDDSKVTDSEQIGSTLFRLKHQLTGANINCTFDAAMFRRVKEALPSRVEVSGLATFNKKGWPTSIEVRDFRELPRDVNLLSLPPVDITGGMDSAEYLERVRSGD